MSVQKPVTTSNQPVSIQAELVKSESMSEATPEISPRTGKPKRRKATRACIHCQRTHLTCDNNRPCERCVSRGFADTCRDGTRKKAKYLGNDDPQKARQHAHETPPVPPRIPPSTQPVPIAPTSIQQPSEPPQTISAPPLSVHNAATAPVPSYLMPEYFPKHFQSMGADSEYNVLSSILGTGATNHDGSPYSDQSLEVGYPIGTTPGAPGEYTLESFNVNELVNIEQESPPNWPQPPRPPPVSLTINQPWDDPQRQQQYIRLNPSQVYLSVQQPFPYTPGFHALFAYLKSRFNKEQLMEIVQSMAKYRPSFIAYASSLTQEDLIFLEQCFQRSLLEYERYFTLSGTPTIIWRRTGQIAAVGPEFCMLTGYNMSELLPIDGGSGKFICELMDDQSTINYFRTFSEIAFGDHRGTRMNRCMLVSKGNKHIRTASVLTLKRDMFGIPMLIIGNFLPILQ